jgi:hypothetical protein
MLDNPKRFPTRGVYLVACVGTKRIGLHRARDLYRSDWFCKARRVVEATGCPWFILSARHGLLHPSEKVNSYDATLKTMSVAERRSWAADVFMQITERLSPSHFVFLAGTSYRQFLAPSLLAWGATIEVPLEALPIGKQLQALREAANAR